MNKCYKGILIAYPFLFLDVTIDIEIPFSPYALCRRKDPSQAKAKQKSGDDSLRWSTAQES